MENYSGIFRRPNRQPGG